MKSTQIFQFLPLVVLIVFINPIQSFTTNTLGNNRQQSTCLLLSQQPQQSRLDFLSNTAKSAAAVVLGVNTVWGTGGIANAADSDAVKGTKKDPAFEACLSKCMYECTKPKGTEQKSRSECLPECKRSCATTKAQLLLGDPVKK